MCSWNTIALGGNRDQNCYFSIKVMVKVIHLGVIWKAFKESDVQMGNFLCLVRYYIFWKVIMPTTQI